MFAGELSKTVDAPDALQTLFSMILHNSVKAAAKTASAAQMKVNAGGVQPHTNCKATGSAVSARKAPTSETVSVSLAENTV